MYYSVNQSDNNVLFCLSNLSQPSEGCNPPPSSICLGEKPNNIVHNLGAVGGITQITLKVQIHHLSTRRIKNDLDFYIIGYFYFLNKLI